jgi:hypothetical protein
MDLFIYLFVALLCFKPIGTVLFFVGLTQNDTKKSVLEFHYGQQ